jgi:hypothetical protein
MGCRRPFPSLSSLHWTPAIWKSYTAEPARKTRHRPVSRSSWSTGSQPVSFRTSRKDRLRAGALELRTGAQRMRERATTRRGSLRSPLCNAAKAIMAALSVQ